MRAPDDLRAATLALVERVLQDDCDPTATIFELGGSSLAAIQIVWLVNEELAVAVSLTDLFDAPDIASFAELVRARGG
jgi:acyl carrier protein